MPLVPARHDGIGASPPVPSERDPLVGVVLGGQYRVEERIGIGAMGQVYRAQHLASGRDVAVKILNADEAADPITARRFQLEASAMSRLRHPNNLAVLDFGQTGGGLLYLVTEILRGRTLGAILRTEAPLEPRRIVHLLSQALAALAEAHAAGIIHRDFKPENVFVEPGNGVEQVRVIDYGIAKVSGAHTKLTESGSVCGTPDYMAPEQIRGVELDGRADVYAAGVMLYEMLTGSRPFAGSMLNVLSLHLHHPPEPPQLRRLDRKVPARLEAVCLRALVKDPKRRIASALQMRDELQAALADSTVDAPPPFPSDALAATEVKRFPLAFIKQGGREAALERLVSTQRQAVLVVGQPGGGRSRIVEEWRQQVVQRGERVVFMRPDPTGARRSWLPVRRALAAILGVPERPSAGELDAATVSRPLDRIGLRELFGLSSVAVEEERPFRRREAFAAAAGVLRDAGVALACEDVDRYDRPSVEVVQALMFDGGLGRVVVTATARGDLPEVDEVVLEPLTSDEVGALGLDPDVLEAARLLSYSDDPGATRGLTPLAIEQAQRAAIECSDDGSAAVRLESLLPSARRVLVAVVVAGTEIDAELLAALTESSDVLAAVASLASRGLLRHEGGCVVLPSPTLRDALYAALGDDERRALHKRLASLLAARAADPALLAHHAWSEDPQTASIDLLERAMAAARLHHDEQGAARWAIRAVKAARGAARRGDAAAGALRARLSVSLGDCLLGVGDAARAEAAFKEALGHGGDDPRIAVLARRGLGRAALRAGRAAIAEAELLGAIDRAGDDSLAGELYLELATVRDHLGRSRDAETALIKGSVRAPAAPEVSWRLHLALAEHAHNDGRLDDALALLGQALQAAEGCTPLAHARVEALMAVVAHSLGDETAGQHRDAAIDALRRLGDRRTTAELLLGSALAAPLDDSAPRAALAEAGELARQVGWLEGVARAQQALRALG